MSKSVSTTIQAGRWVRCSAKSAPTAPETSVMAAVSAICDGLLAIVRNDTARDLTMRQLAVLATLALHPDVESRTVRSISKRLNVNKPVITRAADALEGAGYLRRRQHVDDKRVVVLEVTPSGSKFLRALVSV